MNKKIPLEAQILKLFPTPDAPPFRERDIAKQLRLGAGRRGELRAVLRRLELDGKIQCSRGGRWGPAKPTADDGRTMTGILKVRSSGTYWLQPDNPSIDTPLVDEKSVEASGAMAGDRVEAELSRQTTTTRMFGKEGSSKVARVTRVLERKRAWIVGTLRQTPYYAYLTPMDGRIKQNIKLTDAPAEMKSFVGRLVAARLEMPGENYSGMPEATFAKVLGNPDDPRVEIPALLHDHGLFEEFDSPIQKAAMQLQKNFKKRGASAKDRRDLRKTLTFTIDPSDAHDYDDAISIECLPGGGWKLGVHIADVSSFVERDSVVDKEALRRGNTTYLVDRAISMLPKDLTVEVCSLQPDEDHLTHSVEIVYDAKGRIKQSETYPAIIRSAAKLAYEDVQAFLDGQAGAIPAPLRKAVTQLQKLTRLLRAQRFEHGALDFSTPELHCELDANGNPVAFTQRGAIEAYHLIEECMLEANKVVAKKIFDATYPGIYRTHEPPAEEQWARMNDELHALGHRETLSTVEDINRVARSVLDKPDQYMVTLVLLRNMKRAIYESERRPHFGLGFEFYTHFTSPIRRYTDLVTHRILKAVERRKPSGYSKGELDKIALHCSDTERESMALEQQSLQLKRIRYYADRLKRHEIGPWRGVITSLNPKGLIVELSDTFQQGLVPYHTMTGHYVLADDGFSATAPRGKFKLGQPIDVCLASVDEMRKRVDFYLPGTPKKRNSSAKKAKQWESTPKKPGEGHKKRRKK